MWNRWIMGSPLRRHKEEVIALLRRCAEAEDLDALREAEEELFQSSYWKDYACLRKYYTNHWKDCKEVFMKGHVYF